MHPRAIFATALTSAIVAVFTNMGMPQAHAATDPVLIGAGDIAKCGSSESEKNRRSHGKYLRHSLHRW